MPPFRFVGYAIVSADGMLAAANHVMPQSLKFPSDQRFFEAGLDEAALLVHGRNSGEDQPRSPQRKRLILTRNVTAPTKDPANARAVLWNPAHASFEAAAAVAGVSSGEVAPIGGTSVFEMFLDRYDAFFLSQAPHIRLPDGVPVFGDVPKKSPQQVLQAHGLSAGEQRVLDAANDVVVTAWRRTRGA
jgi:dihydrofolate reductase